MSTRKRAIRDEILKIDTHPPGGVCTELVVGRRGRSRIGDLASGGLRSVFILDIGERNLRAKRPMNDLI